MNWGFGCGALLLAVYLPVIGQGQPASSAGFAELQWLDPDASLVTALSFAPPECRIPALNQEEAALQQLGRIAFRNPYLLGGQAARTGMSCQSCHINGHDNPHFFISGLSGPPGTVDVSNGVFSEVRDDGIHNPVPIPVLLDLQERSSFGSVIPHASLADFVQAVIVDEFSGPAPGATLFAALLSYLQSLSSEFCEEKEQVPVTLAVAMQDIDDGLWILHQFAGKARQELNQFVILYLRRQLGQLSQGFNLPGNEQVLTQLEHLARELAAFESMPDPTSSSAWEHWQQQWEQLKSSLRDHESESYFNTARLREYFLNRQN